MTDEELQELCDALRKYIPTKERLHKAAHEIERLQGENDWLRTALRAAQMAKQPDGME
jgi:Arc/MetJ family transcription regulator